jgi:hypothetical protein
MINYQSLQLARWWITIADVKAKIDNEVVPVGIHLGIEGEDPDLIEALEALSKKILAHLERYKLQAVPKDT